MKTLRDAFGEGLARAGAEDPDLYVVDADNHLATRTTAFRDRFPDRFVQAGVAEANMAGIAAGLAYAGHRVVSCTFAAFLIGRGLQVIRDTIALDHLPVLLVGTHAGISVGQDGITHMALDDLSIMRGLPNMTVAVAADPGQVTALLPQLLALDGPAYLRISRWGLGDLPGSSGTTLGQPIVLDKPANLTIVAAGLGAFPAREAAQALREEGVDVGLVVLHTIKPLDVPSLKAILARAQAVVTVEEHWTSGGVFGAVAEFLAQHDPKPCMPVGVPDVFPDGGTEASLFDAYGLTSASIVRAAHTAIAMTKP